MNAADGKSYARAASAAGNSAPISGALAASSAQTIAADRYGDLPLSFEANQGQVDSQVRFLSRGSGYSFFLTQTGAVLSFSPDTHSDSVLRMQLAGASLKSQIEGLDELPGKTNYFAGSDSTRWRTGVANFSRVKYDNIYPGISLVYYGNQRQLEYDFVVAPGADPGQIHLSISGAQNLAIDRAGNLVLHNLGGDVQLLAPRVYQRSEGQKTDGQKKEVSARWILAANHTASFRLGDYDRSRPLVIDPVLMYSSFLGGSEKNALRKIALDAAGNAYVAGYTAVGDFPAAPTPLATTFGNGAQSRGAFVAKIDPSGSNLLYSTYLSGSADEEATGLAVDESGNVYVSGNTHSTDFPTRNALQATCATRASAGTCSSAFLAKISSAGDALLFSTYLGGSGGESARGLAVDAKGSAFLAGVTSSSDFPATSGAAQAKCGGTCQQNAFVARFSPSGDKLIYATYLGGSAVDDASDLAVDSAGNAYITGRTTSTDFPLVTPFQKSCTPDKGSASAACVATAFVAKLKADGSALAYSTYLGGTLGSHASGIAVDSLGSAYVTGSTESADFPLLKPLQKSCGLDSASSEKNCSLDAFLTKFAPTGKALVYSTYIGGAGRDEATGIAVDDAGNASLVGRTESADFPTAKPMQAHLQGTSDAFAVRVSAAGDALTFSTYHGGTATESGNGIALDSRGNIYLTGETTSADFPTKHPFQSSCAGACTSAFVTKMSPPPAGAPVFTSAADNSAAPFTVGTAGPAFSVTTTPAADTITITTGSLPGSLSFTDNGDGTGSITGTPAAGSGGVYTNVVTFTATNGSGSATQDFTVYIDEAPSITSAAATTFTVGTAGTFTVTATGFPAPTLSKTGTLPTGVTFNAGTGVLSGTPAAGTGGDYSITFKATNSVTNDTQTFTLHVDEIPAITSTNNTTFVIGTNGSFTATSTGFPAATFTETGALPANVTLSAAGVLSGTPSPGTAGDYPITLKATNTAGNDTQAFTLHVNQGPAITSTDATTFTVGTAGTFTVTATGTPTPALSEIGALPAGVTFNTGTGVLSGTPSVGTGGVYSISFKATNGVGSVTQPFTLTVSEGPVITSANNTTFVAGTAGTFTVTATGTPAPTFSETGALPTGITFNAGTQKLSGTPAAGTGGTYSIVFHAANGIGTDATQTFTLTVNEAPVITSNATTTFQAAVAGTFTVTATGFPAPTLAETGSLPGGVTFNTGTGVLSGTPAAGTGGSHSITFTAQNGVGGGASQSFTLLVRDFTVIPASNSVSIVQGFASSNITLNIHSVQNYSAAQLNLACTGLPGSGTPAPACGFSANSVALAAAGTDSPTFSVSLTGQTITSGLTAPGTYNVFVAATDAATGLTEPASSNFSLTVVQNQPPHCGVTAAGAPLFQVQQNSSLDITVAAACSDPESSGTSVIDFGDGTTAPGTNVADHTYTAPGSYVVAVTMTDNVAQTSTVAEGLTLAPTVSLTSAQTSSEQTIAVQAPTAASIGTNVTMACSQVSIVGEPNSAQPPSSYGIGCTFNPSTGLVTLSSTSTVGITLATSAPASAANRHLALAISTLGLGMPAVVFLAFGIPAAGSRRQRSWAQKLLRLLPLLLMLSLLLGSVACGGGFVLPGGGGSGTTTPGAYSVTVTGTDSTGNVLTSIIIPLNVTH